MASKGQTGKAGLDFVDEQTAYVDFGAVSSKPPKCERLEKA
jgi:hypothetical protein